MRALALHDLYGLFPVASVLNLKTQGPQCDAQRVTNPRLVVYNQDFYAFLAHGSVADGSAT